MLDGARRLARRFGRVPKATICEDVSGLVLEYDPNTAIGRRLYRKGKFEANEIEFFGDLMSTIPTPRVIDIGANIGIHSLRWAAMHEGLISDLFEPSSSTRAILERNIAHNGLVDRLHVHPLAVSGQCGFHDFYECADNAFSSLKDTGRSAVSKVTKVRAVSLDEWVESCDLERLDLIKVDVEGSEHEVIEGAERTIRRLKPHLFVEIFGGSGSNPDPEATIDLLVNFGYAPYVFAGAGRGRPLRYERHTDTQYNYYFRPVS